MSWTTPGTAIAGEVLTAAFWNEQVRDRMTYLENNANQRIPIFADEAARDAAITSPTEGRVCYLTAPTTPAATGTTTILPSGIVTVYNGSVWVCVTEVGALEGNLGTTSSAVYTPTLGGSPGTNPSVTLVTGTTALVHLNISNVFNSGSNTNVASIAVSGATSLAATDARALVSTGTGNFGFSFTHFITGLTAGTNTFTIRYKTTGGTASFQGRSVIVKGVA